MQLHHASSLLFSFVLAPVARAQTPLHVLHGPEEGSGFGLALALAGDVDGDGREDVLVGAPWSSDDAGLARLISGRTGAVLLELAGAPGALLGAAVARSADLDGDGRYDLALGAPGHAGAAGPDAGAVFVHSSASGALLRVLEPPATVAPSRFGFALADAGDLDHDGAAELVVGAPGYSGDAGRVAIVSGASGVELASLVGLPGEELGWSVAGAGDFDGDGGRDVVAGAPGWSPAGEPGSRYGKAFVVDGETGGVLATWLGESAGERYGACVLGVGDASGSSLDDLLVAAPNSAQWGPNGGRVELRSGGTGAVLQQLVGMPMSQLGRALAALGDVDHDGRMDFAVGAPTHGLHLGAPTGLVRVRSGATGAGLWDVYGERDGDLAGQALAGCDANGDGVLDLALGAPRADAGALLDLGALSVVLLDAPLPESYCAGKVNSQDCTPRIEASGAPSLTAGAGLHVRALDVLAGQPGQLFFGRAAADVPFQGGHLCVAPPLVRTGVLDSGGNGAGCDGVYDFHFAGALMLQHGLAPGERVYAQFWMRDPGDPFGTGLSDALSFVVLL